MNIYKENAQKVTLKRYVKITPSPNTAYDTYYYNIPDRENTWSSILNAVEEALETQWFENEEDTLGIKVTLEVVDTVPEEVEYE